MRFSVREVLNELFQLSDASFAIHFRTLLAKHWILRIDVGYLLYRWFDLRGHLISMYFFSRKVGPKHSTLNIPKRN